MPFGLEQCKQWVAMVTLNHEHAVLSRPTRPDTLLAESQQCIEVRFAAW